MRNHLALLVMTLLLGGTGCYERVVSERPFAGMSSTRNVPTAPDYSQAHAEFLKQHEDRNKKPFDPLGDLIFKPIGGAAKSIGDAFSGGDEEPSDQPTVKPPARPATSAGDVNTPPPAPAPAP